MGGRGSGQWQIGKPTTEDCLALDIRRLSLHPGEEFTLRWRRPGADPERAPSIRVYTQRDGVVLGFYLGDDTVIQPVHYDRTPCNYGGERTWWRCPRCGRRCAALYLRYRAFGCRVCCDLRYPSQGDTWQHAYLRKAQNIRERLGGSPSLLEPFPCKPKGMHWSTYARLQQTAREAESIFLSASCLRAFGPSFFSG